MSIPRALSVGPAGLLGLDRWSATEDNFCSCLSSHKATTSRVLHSKEGLMQVPSWWPPWPLRSFKPAVPSVFFTRGVALHPPGCLNQNLRISLYPSFTLVLHIHSVTKSNQLNLLISLRIHAVYHFSWFCISNATAFFFMDHYNCLLNWSPCFHSPHPTLQCF